MPADLLTLVVVTGQPGTGKTTLARRLAGDLRLPLFEKDGIKEQLFDTLGWSDRAWSRRLGVASIELLFQCMERTLAAGVATVVECNFDPVLCAPRFEKLRARYGCQIIQIVCRAEKDVVYERYRARWSAGDRHPGHVDESVFVELRARLDEDRDMGLPVESARFDLYTTDFAAMDYAGLLRDVGSKLIRP
ncbi:MAG TPA: AAA family ATPase [Ktedonobacterales bacterium]|nr:AAA family ATPase [Ktedonobacterales bacterium]